MQKFDVAKVTAEQKAKWDDHAETYAEFILSSDPADHASKQVLEAFTRHRQLPAGKSRGRSSLLSTTVSVSVMYVSFVAGSCILGLASSFGRPAVPLARALPHVSVISTDLSPVSAPWSASTQQLKGFLTSLPKLLMHRIWQTSAATPLQLQPVATALCSCLTLTKLYKKQTESCNQEDCW